MESTKFYKVLSPDGNLLKLLKTTNDLVTVEKNNFNNAVIQILEEDFFALSQSTKTKRIQKVENTTNKNADIRAQRTAILEQSDWTQLPDVPESTRLKWQQYRQALRDITLQEGFPENIVWPQPPQ
jgi:hypothetical protein